MIAVAAWPAACVQDNDDFTRIGAPPDAAVDRAGADMAPAADAPAQPGADSAELDVLPAVDLGPDVGGGSDLGSDLGTDVAGAALGAACSAGSSCASGICVDGVCCNTACTDMCWACNQSFAPGTCVPAAAGDDPRNQCAAEPINSCGRSGGCDGRGRCELRAQGTECAAPSCTGSTEIAASSCDGAGVCRPGASKSCAPNACAGDRCAVACSASNPCTTGLSCVGGRCEAGGPVLHWRLDETAPGQATDASGNGFTGVATGSGALPAPSTDVPKANFGSVANPRSRAFGTTGRPGVVLPAVPAALRVPESTLSIWFKATTVGASGADVVNLGGDLLLRVKSNRIEFVKRKSMTETQYYDIAAANDIQGHLDGRWHHLAGVASNSGMRIYLDGDQRGSDGSTLPVIYRGPECWLARDGLTTVHDFQGLMDDFRIYPRPLGTVEIGMLARGEK